MTETSFEAKDSIFGEISCHLDAGQLSVSGAEIPTIELVRTATSQAVKHIPIGTRDPRALNMTVAGRRVDLRPGKGRLSRRSYRICATTPDGPLLFAPSGPTKVRLVRGKSYRGDNELGIFEKSLDGFVEAIWSEDETAFGVTAKGLRPTPAEAAIGYALAAGFGTGAKFIFAAFGPAIENLFPG